jgi:hypothetical protein
MTSIPYHQVPEIVTVPDPEFDGVEVDSDSTGEAEEITIDNLDAVKVVPWFQAGA